MRKCIKCENAVVTGGHYQATLTDPEEKPEFDRCGYSGKEIERYLRLFDYDLDLKRPLVEEPLMAEYCPFYCEVEDD